MRLITYRVGDINIRHSVVRLLGHDEITKSMIYTFLQDERNINCTQATAILAADRCCLYIENFKQRHVIINSEHFLITLIKMSPLSRHEKKKLK